jgi:hypothetical protein
MATYGNPHILPPIQCPANIPTWIDSTITANTTRPRKVHIDELRTRVNAELSRRGLSTDIFTDSPIVADTTKLRKIHIDELRASITKIHLGDCVAEGLYCPQDALGCVDFTDPVITANSTKPRRLHVTELRTALQTLMTSCICEAEQCQYCADCGYYYQTCTYQYCACDNHKYVECGNYMVNHYLCASTNLPVGTAHPYKSASGDPLSLGAWDGAVPWAMCSYTPPGSNWGTCEYQTGHNHYQDWVCKCNPFTWP